MLCEPLQNFFFHLLVWAQTSHRIRQFLPLGAKRVTDAKKMKEVSRVPLSQNCFCLVSKPKAVTVTVTLFLDKVNHKI